jgi:hypothetical protein
MKHLWMAAIALGLWANAAALWLKPVHAKEATELLILNNIAENIQALVQGGAICLNKKVCE